ncbi:helix-turn-helix transcriptional regulator [Enterococcus hulanensis]|uniref:helix-turn-helix domain-containing protein n=1 Tax=Enterococcus hulanensis TaxID=2559929 RepID=UPI0028901148|nr:helix-turn-helix transcriptional regulator [Enterococcus hulanensis]MDT2661066.1 helix-turn-helix transcriptional regulator [Enterococcus hulanensis]
MNTYERIRELSKERKISIRQLEKEFGYSNGYIGSWKRQTPNSVEIARLADFFGVSTDYLLGRTDDPSPAVDKLSEQEQKLLMRFRRGSQNLTDEEKEIYERQAMNLFDYINQTMHDLDEKNKPK